MQKEILTPQEHLVHELVSKGQVRAHYSRLVGHTQSRIPIVDGRLYENMRQVNTSQESFVVNEKSLVGVYEFATDSSLIWLDELDKYVTGKNPEGTIYLHGVDSSCRIGRQIGDGVQHGGISVRVFKPGSIGK